MRPERTCRSPLRRSAESLRTVSAIGLLAMSVSIGRLYCPRRRAGGKAPLRERRREGIIAAVAGT